MTAKVHTLGSGAFATSPEMFVSLLLTRVREHDNIEGVIYAVVTKEGHVDVGNSSLEIGDIVYAARAMMMYADDLIRKNADLGGVIDPVTGDPA